MSLIEVLCHVCIHLIYLQGYLTDMLIINGIPLTQGLCLGKDDRGAQTILLSQVADSTSSIFY